MHRRARRIWVDLTNSPNVLFFEPIIGELTKRGHEVTITVRHFADTVALARRRGVPAYEIGCGHDATSSELVKRVGYHARVARLVAFARKRRFDVAVGHQSFSQAGAAERLGIPTVGAADYEHCRMHAFRHAERLLVPRAIPAEAFQRWGIGRDAIQPYDGLKEDVYLAGFRASKALRARLSVAEDDLLVCFRPVATHAHYNRGHRNDLEADVLHALVSERRARVVVLPRTHRQYDRYQALARRLPALIIPVRPLDGPALISVSNLVVGGGGTMTREAAVLGVPAVSCFPGPVGAVDRWLESQGRLTLLRRLEDLKIAELVARRGSSTSNPAPLEQIVSQICEVAG